jgi:hypothetical protein
MFEFEGSFSEVDSIVSMYRTFRSIEEERSILKVLQSQSENKFDSQSENKIDSISY